MHNAHMQLFLKMRKDAYDGMSAERDILGEGIARLKRSREASLEIQLDIRRLETEVEENLEAEELALKKMEDMKPDVEDQVCSY